MNQAARTYWNEYWERQGREKPASVSAWPFGADPDQLARLVIEGVKTATCSALFSYEAEQEPLPSVGDYSIILDGRDEPVAIIQTVEVTVVPMNEVPEDFAVAEGEGDRTYRYWRQVHETFFTKELNRLGREFSDDIPLVCERFRLVDVKS
ncbi:MULTISPECIES: ASCH domain-containing protein [Paenibacillus]|uniref:ASCH domain-containing protein n=1 Tax=Paenibacillus albilobatus TaxID=2716884 RepID=A0A919XNJ9_9BACL|nr:MULTISPECIES: ASCH domain-containing protein [Paenibacillus]GIO34688.1 ASCH domain-containing protein [Paenibacillus albilobatus]